MASRAELVSTEHGLVPRGQGWYVLNARAAQWWLRDGRGALCEFEGAGFEGATDFPQLGINLTVLAPGEPMAMYHRENDQEDFLVLRGEAVLVVEGEERPLRAWDFVHCPAGTGHVIVAAGEGPCLVLAVGALAFTSGTAAAKSDPLRDFIRESNRGTTVWFVRDLASLEAKLAG